MYDLSGELNVMITIWWLQKLGKVWQKMHSSTDFDME